MKMMSIYSTLLLSFSMSLYGMKPAPEFMMDVVANTKQEMTEINTKVMGFLDRYEKAVAQRNSKQRHELLSQFENISNRVETLHNNMSYYHTQFPKVASISVVLPIIEGTEQAIAVTKYAMDQADIKYGYKPVGLEEYMQ
jgi:hypothetical protein